MGRTAIARKRPGCEHEPADPWPAAYRIETRRVTLRCFEPGDAEATRVALERGRDALAPWVELPAGRLEVDDVAARLIGFRNLFDRGERFHYAAFVDDHDDLAGTVAVEPIRGRGLLVGGWIDPGYAGEGLASEAIGAVCRVAFELGAARYLETRIHPDNARSIRLANRLGFTHEATLPRRAVAGDTVHDEMIWARHDVDGVPAHAPRDVHAFDAVGRRWR